MKDELFAATQIPDIYDSLDAIYRITNDAMVARKWDQLSSALQQLDPTKMSYEAAVGVLTGALPTRTSTGYHVFFNRTHKVLVIELGAGRTERILQGLEPEYKS